MTLQRIPALAACLVMTATASAQAEEQHEIGIVVTRAAGDQPTAIRWVGSGNAGSDMHGMQIGETRSIIDESGRSVLITREEGGFRFDVDGKTVVVPEIGAPGEYMTLADGSDVTADFAVEIVGDQFALPTHAGKSITIVSNLEEDRDRVINCKAN